MAGTDNAVIGGLYGENDIQARLRKYAQDKKAFQFLVLYEKDSTSILKVISEKFGMVTPDNISDFQFRYPELNELPYEFVVSTTSNPVGNVDNLSIKDDHAAGLHVNHHLTVKGLFTKVTGATDESATRTTTYPLSEALRITEVGLPGSGAGGAGYTNVRVRRMWPFDSYGTATAITAAMSLVLSNNTAREDALPNPAVSMNTGYEYNYIQTTRESYGVSEHIKSGIETFLQGKPIDLALRLCQIRYAKTIERAILEGRRTSKMLGNKLEYETGGILEFIAANASTNMISFPKIIQPKNFIWLVKDLFDTAGTEELWLFGGTNYVTALATAFDNKVGFTKDEAASLKYAMKVYSLDAVGRPGRIYIAGAPVLNQLGMTNEAIVLNLEQKYQCFQIAEKESLSDRPEDEATLSPKGQYSTYRELYSMWGLIRRLSKTHFWIIDTSISY